MSDGQKIPGAVAAVAALITALAGAVPVVLALRDDGGSPSPAASATPDPAASSSASPTARNGNRGDTGEAILVASPAQLQFGRLLPGLAGKTESVSVMNAGDAPVTLGSARVTGAAATAFSIVTSECEDAELKPGGSCSVEIRFSPAGTGALVASLVVEHDGGLPLTVPLTGTGGLL